MQDLFNKLNKAIQEGNQSEVERLKEEILLAGRDKSIDQNFIQNIRSKTLCKNLKRIINSGDVSTSSCAKIVSSLITHVLIEKDTNNVNSDDLGIKELYVILGGFVNGDEENAVNAAKKFITSRYSEFL